METVNTSKKDEPLKSLAVGLGFFTFYDHKGRTLHALFQSIGEPVSMSLGIGQRKTSILFGESEDQIVQFLDNLVEKSQRPEPQKLSVFQWNVRASHWSMQSTEMARPLASVILPQHTKTKVLDDMELFLSDKTKTFYRSHGIPYRRSYLFYGIPGSGKTSFAQALAGHFGCSISLLQPADPSLTDQSLREAVVSLPKRTIFVLEDIDSLFTKSRAKSVNSAISFSGLLNALDGVGSGKGQICILTTNHKDNLDPALIRKGRVDEQVQFLPANNEQMKLMWEAFYPDHFEEADKFASLLRDGLRGKPVATSSLQHFFVTNRLTSAEEALCKIGEIVDELQYQESVSAGF